MLTGTTAFSSVAVSDCKIYLIYVAVHCHYSNLLAQKDKSKSAPNKHRAKKRSQSFQADMSKIPQEPFTCV